jgi:chromosome segregation ATPase
MFDESMHIDVSELLNFNEADIKIVCSEETTNANAEDTQQAPGAEPSDELDRQADLVRGLLQEFKSLTVRACDTALREAQHSAQVEELASVEVASLRLQLQDKNEALETRDREWHEREAVASEKLESLETILRDRDAQLENCQTRSRALLGEIDGLNLRLNEAATAIKQAETRFRDFADHQQTKINGLRDDVKAKEEALQGKEAALRELDETSRAAISDLERQLQSARANLETKEAALREKEAALQAAASREQSVTQLIQQLAAESQRLMAELREKNNLVSEMESRTYRHFDNARGSTDGVTVQ